MSTLAEKARMLAATLERGMPDYLEPDLDLDDYEDLLEYEEAVEEVAREWYLDQILALLRSVREEDAVTCSNRALEIRRSGVEAALARAAECEDLAVVIRGTA